MSKNALIIVDVQNDFCPGGSYPVPNGDEVIPPLNKMITFAKKNEWIIFASRDWHPISTLEKENWVAHCVKNSKGAEYHPSLKIDDSIIIVSKGEDLSDKHYSAFNGDNISLNKELKIAGVSKVFIGGLALDYCVKNTALDSIKNGFETTVLLDASKGIYKRKSKQDVIQELKDADVKLLKTDQVVD